MDKKRGYHEKIEALLKEWTTKIDFLKVKAEKAKVEAKIKYYGEIKDLRTKQKLAKRKLQDLRESEDDAWEELKAGVGNALDDLRDALKHAASRFKKKLWSAHELKVMASSNASKGQPLQSVPQDASFELRRVPTLHFHSP
jgi:chromosome segregation ATPase